VSSLPARHGKVCCTEKKGKKEEKKNFENAKNYTDIGVDLRIEISRGTNMENRTWEPWEKNRKKERNLGDNKPCSCEQLIKILQFWLFFIVNLMG